MKNLKVCIYIKNQPIRLGGRITPAILAAFEGFKKHGITAKLVNPHLTFKCDLAVLWGIRKNHQMRSGKRALVLERGYLLDRLSWTSCGFDGLNGYANFCNKNSPSDRWNLYYKDLLKPWRRNYKGNYVLIMGQVTNDAAVKHIDIEAWYLNTFLKLREHDFNVAFRPHPKMRFKTRFEIMGLCPILRNSLEESLAKAKWVVTLNSNSGVDSVLAGIPTVTIDEGAMAWGVTGHDCAKPPPMPSRRQWSYDMGYTQYTYEEIASGLMWDHKKHSLEELLNA